MKTKEYKKVQLGPKEVEVPASWEVKKMKELINFKNGYAFSSRNYTDKGKIVFRMSNIDRQGNLNVNNDNIKHCSEEEYNKLPNYHLEKGDLVICMTDMSPEMAILGRTTIINKNNRYILNQRVGRIRIKEKDLIRKRYLHYYTNLKVYLDYMKATATGTAQYNTSTKTIKNTNVFLPSLSEQEKIAEVLSTVDEVIEKTNQIIEKSKKLKKGLIQDLLTKGIGHDELKKVQLGPKEVEVPEDWKIEKIGSLGEVKGGKRLPKGHNYSKKRTPFPYLRIVDFKDGTIQKEKLKYLKEKTYKKINRYSITSNDVFISIVGTIGLAGIIPDDLDGAILTENAAKIFNLKEVNGLFLSYYLNSSLGQNEISRFVISTTQPKLALFRIKKIEIPLPPLSEQEKIAEVLSTVDKKIEKEKEYKEKLQEIKKGLMQDLLTGKVRVNNLINN